MIIFTLHRTASAQHGIGGHDLDALDRTLSALRRLSVPIVSLREILASLQGRGTLHPTSVCFTLDDGYWDQAESTVPLLLAHGVRPTIFLITGFLDGLLWPWDAQVHDLFQRLDAPSLTVRVGSGCLIYDTSSSVSRAIARSSFSDLCKSVSDSQREKLIAALVNSVCAGDRMSVPSHHRPMTWEQARALEAKGVDFGSHSVSHVVFSQVSAERAQAELQGSQNRLIEELQDPISAFAWPIGRRPDFGMRDLQIAARVGYQCTLSMYCRDAIAQPKQLYRRAVLLHRHSFLNSTGKTLRTVIGLSRTNVLTATRRIFGSRPRKVLQDTANSLLDDDSTSAEFGDQWSPLERVDDDRVDWKRVKRLVFVCKGNICRSPYAEQRARAVGLESISCGIEAAPGAEADGRALRNASIRGIDLSSHRSRRLDQVRMYSTDLIVYMEAGQRAAVIGYANSVGLQHTLAGLWSSAPEVAKTIIDPFGRDDVTFQSVFERLDNVVRHLASTMRAAGRNQQSS